MQDDFLEILSTAQKLKNKRTKKSLNIKLFSNSVINPLDKVIKYYLDKKNVSSHIEFANFNTILPSDKKINFNIGLIIWECENLFADGYSDLEKLSQKQCKEYGYKENTDKFADCVLELVKINSNSQKDSSNEISEEIKKSNNIERGKALLEISKIFGERPPKETVKVPQQPNCKLNPINLRIICY